MNWTPVDKSIVVSPFVQADSLYDTLSQPFCCMEEQQQKLKLSNAWYVVPVERLTSAYDPDEPEARFESILARMRIDARGVVYLFVRRMDRTTFVPYQWVITNQQGWSRTYPSMPTEKE